MWALTANRRGWPKNGTRARDQGEFWLKHFSKKTKTAVPVGSMRGPPGPFEEAHVHQVYDTIAPSFSSTRHSPWPQVVEFLRGLPHKSLVADVGCGNGRHMMKASGHRFVGVDRCASLVREGRRGGHQVVVGDALSLPLRSDAFDAALSIAVLHHVSTPSRRAQGLVELMRVVRPGGQALVCVWAQEQPETSRRWEFKEQDVWVPWTLPDRRGHVQRYCHVFCQGELEKLAQELPQVTVEACWSEAGNWLAVLSKGHPEAE